MVSSRFGMTEKIEEILARVDEEEEVPRWLEYLPGIFHAEGERRHGPLWALLLLMEDNFGRIGRIIDNIEMYFDADLAPTATVGEDCDFLEWLGSWVAFIPVKEWSEAKKRYVVRQAVDLHKYRGTATGLRYMLNLFFDIEVDIKEWVWPKGMTIGVRNTIGVDTCLYDRPGINTRFVVIWKLQPDELGPDFKKKLKNIRALIDREKPAHTWCYFHIEYAVAGGRKKTGSKREQHAG